ncbi:hypothetical protein CYXG_00209 [Synechococcus phage S-SSM4]|jgi:hypothetical protein|uniref:DUF1825 domain-containing protein n=1 Tax=Synechococcus phage S-SSM4 TaxID=536466 RepID=M1U2T1_9CAUD|nr:hypothetical protein CYXG_00209 [Synechococcus phage S-SSM4]AGG54273.1 hypothetical protein CYXG_00209 [Synechococcus phage S-SSM4]AGG54369.1 hypothetical protein CYWG_00085 [Cyanophage S-SSM6b]|tara:strand:- start:186 stop:509 length:324 start_codon:yes stop_codon:yes gene_type:complete
MTFFQSENVQEEINNIFKFYQKLSYKQNRLAGMNKEERLDHIDKTKELVEKQKLFYTRLALAAMEDQEASDLKTRINAMSQAFGYRDLGDCFDSMIEHLDNAKNKIS